MGSPDECLLVYGGNTAYRSTLIAFDQLDIVFVTLELITCIVGRNLRYHAFVVEGVSMRVKSVQRSGGKPNFTHSVYI